MTEVSSTRLYLGNLPRHATKADVENHFATHGTGEITEIKLMNGFGFIEYKDAMDARDVVPAFHGSDFMGERLIVQFARGARRNDNFPHQERAAPRPRRTPFRMQITGLPVETSWQDLKDFARQSGLDVVYSEVGRDHDGKGFVEYETQADLRSAVEKLDKMEFKNSTVRCLADISSPPPQPPQRSRNPYPMQAPDDRARDRFRSRSPPGRRGGGYGPPPDDYYRDRRGPPRGYSPRRDDYRRRSPPPHGYYESRERYGRSPPRARGPTDDNYGPPRSRYPEEDYDPRAPPPRRAGGSGNGVGGSYEADPYVNGHNRPYDRPASPRGRPRSPGAPRSYDEGGYRARPY